MGSIMASQNIMGSGYGSNIIDIYSTKGGFGSGCHKWVKVNLR